MFYLGCALAVVLSPFMMLWVIGGQILIQSSDSRWALPTSDSNPLYLGNPLLFAHFACQLSVACSAGYLLASAWCGWHIFVMGLTCALVGVGWFLGLLWSVRLAGDRIQPRYSRPAVFGCRIVTAKRTFSAQPPYDSDTP